MIILPNAIVTAENRKLQRLLKGSLVPPRLLARKSTYHLSAHRLANCEICGLATLGHRVDFAFVNMVEFIYFCNTH